MTGTLVDDFEGPGLDRATWIDHYLPHWTTSDRSAARFDIGSGGLRLRIDADQPAWRPEDGPMRVSNIQTGAWAGPLGSASGQHRTSADLRVVTEVSTTRSWTPSAGSVEVVAAANPDPTLMVGIWLVGFEQSAPEDSGEICLAELFGGTVGNDSSLVRIGIKAHHDPRLSTDVRDVRLPIDTSKPHQYGAEWGPDGVRILVDGSVVGEFDQVLGYPLQLMIDLFEFPEGSSRDPEDYPKTARVLSVRGRASTAVGSTVR